MKQLFFDNVVALLLLFLEEAPLPAEALRSLGLRQVESLKATAVHGEENDDNIIMIVDDDDNDQQNGLILAL